MQLAHYHIDRTQPPFIIAEMSGNHQQSLDCALAIVDAAAAAGAHAIKLQTYTADTMTLDTDAGAFHIEHPLWGGQSLYALYQQAYTPWAWHEPIFQRAQQHGLIAFSTPFDDTAVAFLESLQVPAYKIAAFENGDLALIRAVAATGKPVFISTGMATLSELEAMVTTARHAGCRDLVLLKCTSAYPAQQTDCHVRTIPHLRELFACEVGLSDHTPGIGAAVAAVALGATVIEKHLTLDRAAGGVDAAFSLEPTELAQLCQEGLRAWQSLGTIHYGPSDAEQSSRRWRRSLYVVQDIAAGDVFNNTNVRAIRPGDGLAPQYLDIVLGRAARQFIARGTPLTWDLI